MTQLPKETHTKMGI